MLHAPFGKSIFLDVDTMPCSVLSFAKMQEVLGSKDDMAVSTKWRDLGNLDEIGRREYYSTSITYHNSAFVVVYNMKSWRTRAFLKLYAHMYMLQTNIRDQPAMDLAAFALTNYSSSKFGGRMQITVEVDCLQRAMEGAIFSMFEIILFPPQKYIYFLQNTLH